jgi:hypothetical protein
MAKSTDRERDRVFQVSTNRGSAQHKLRYVEASVAADELADCRMCRTALVAQPTVVTPSKVQSVDASEDEQPTT